MKVDELQFIASTSRLYSAIVSTNEVDWFTGLEPDDQYSYQVNCEIYAVEVQDCEEVSRRKIGFVDGTFFDVMEANINEESAYDAFDAVSADTEAAYAALTNADGEFKDEVVGMEQNIFYLDNIYIDEEFRGQGIAKKVIYNLDKLLHHMLGFKLGCIITIPTGIKITNKEDHVEINVIKDAMLTARLRNYMRKLGYKRIDDTEFMYINPDYKYRGFKV